MTGRGSLATARPRPVTPVGIAAELVAGARRRLEASAGNPDRGAGEVGTPLTDLARAEELLAGLDDYCSTMTAPASPALRALADRTAATAWSDHDGPVALEQEMLSGHVEGALLALLVRLAGARRVLEIGTFTGYATLAMAEALPDDGDVVTCELDPSVARSARDGFAGTSAGRRVRVEVGPAGETLARLAGDGETFDLVFVDADKTGYAGYVDALLDHRLLRVGGLLVLDNTLLQGEPWAGGGGENGAAIAHVNRRLRDDPRLTPVLLPVRDGVTLALREPDEPGPS